MMSKPDFHVRNVGDLVDAYVPDRRLAPAEAREIGRRLITAARRAEFVASQIARKPFAGIARSKGDETS